MSIGVGLCLPQLGPHVTMDAVREFCRRAEELGYASLWVQDHFLWPLQPRRAYGGRPNAPVPVQYQSVLAPTELLTAAAMLTRRVRLGTSVLVAGNHWPVPLAQRLATLDMISGGRLLVGLGVGWNAEEHDASGTSITERGARMDDFIGALLACWGEDPVTWEGPFFRVPPAVVRPKPVQQPRPLLLSGMWSAAGLERTRTHFDAWNPAGQPVARVAATVADLDARRPEGMAPLRVFHRTFAQLPNQASALGDPVERLAREAAEARDAGFEEIILEHNFCTDITSPQDWASVPDRYRPVLDAAC